MTVSQTVTFLDKDDNCLNLLSCYPYLIHCLSLYKVIENKFSLTMKFLLFIFTFSSGLHIDGQERLSTFYQNHRIVLKIEISFVLASGT